MEIQTIIFSIFILTNTQSDISQGRLYRESLRTAKADPDRNEPYVLRGKRV